MIIVPFFDNSETQSMTIIPPPIDVSDAMMNKKKPRRQVLPDYVRIKKLGNSMSDTSCIFTAWHTTKSVTEKRETLIWKELRHQYHPIEMSVHRHLTKYSNLSVPRAIKTWSTISSSGIVMDHIVMDKWDTDMLDFVVGHHGRVSPSKNITQTSQWVNWTVFTVLHIARVLIKLNKMGLAHRDVSLENILVNFRKTTHVCLCDFGLVDKLNNVPNLIKIVGKEAYMAPELRGPSRSFDLSKCDVFSLGVCALGMLAGYIPPVNNKSWIKQTQRDSGLRNLVMYMWADGINYPYVTNLLVNMLCPVNGERISCEGVLSASIHYQKQVK